MSKNHIYLDHAASTPVREEVIDAMQPYWTDFYGNPSSVHTFGRRANRGLEEARNTFAELLNAEADEIVFTGCGSESDNLALRGVMMAARVSNRGNHLITCSVEHKAVLETARQLRDSFGFNVTILPVDRFGRVDPEDVRSAISSDTVLISIMTANNEIGTMQPIFEIGKIAKENGVLLHTDAIQAAVTFEWDMATMPIDLLSLAPHKFYGPKGIGVLFVRSDIELVSSLTGGGQEDGRRSGTENVPYAVGAAEAFRLAISGRDSDLAHYRRLRDRLIAGVQHAFPGDSQLTGHAVERLDHNASFAFRNVSGNDMLMHLDVNGISASSGSACLTGDPQPSQVLMELGLGEEWTRGGLRLSVGRQNSDEEVDQVLNTLPGIVDNLRNLATKYGSPKT
jgi:cysteine desulfurase